MKGSKHPCSLPGARDGSARWEREHILLALLGLAAEEFAGDL